MDRKKKLLYNTVTSLFSEVCTIVCGFILPRLILTSFGSQVNGLVNSISQFLGFITLCECGVGAVVQSAFYKPLANGDNDGISKIFVSSKRFFNKIAYILIAYVLVLFFVYPKIINSYFDFWFTASLLLVISISSFAQYFVGIPYRLLQTADQRGYISLGLNGITVVFNTIACAILIKFGASIHIVKLTTSLIFLIRPLGVWIYGKKNYNLNLKITYKEEPIKQKWNGVSQHIATVIGGYTDTLVLSVFSTLENVSIYSVYHLVTNGIKTLVVSLTSGFQSLFGSMLAKNEMEKLDESFSSFEWFMHTVCTFIFSIVGIVIIPFVYVYTKGVDDAQYINILFGLLMVVSQFVYCLRLPYNIIVLAAGHYKQTQMSAIIEAFLNVIISIIFVFKFGIIGVAVGTVVAMLYRTVYFVIYISKNILNRSVKYFIKHILVDILSIGFIAFIYLLLPSFFTLGNYTYFALIILGIKSIVMGGFVIIFVNLIFYRKYLFNLPKIILKKGK